MVEQARVGGSERVMGSRGAFHSQPNVPIIRMRGPKWWLLDRLVIAAVRERIESALFAP
jgi:hypothetical protein